MTYQNLRLNPNQIIYWFNAIRNVENDKKTRILDAFWAGQLNSKLWLVDELNKLVNSNSNVYVFGGWVGVLSSILFQCSTFKINKIRSIDLDSWCEKVADDVCKIHEMNEWRFKARTADMSIYEYEWGISPDIVINTSAEHVTQATYDQWYEKIPANTTVVVQGNNFYNCSEHIRCSSSLDNFKIQNRVSDLLFEGELETDMYTRYMCIWKK